MPTASPGPNFAKAHQFKIVSAPNGGKFFISAGSGQQDLYTTLPPPDVGGVAQLRRIGILGMPGRDPGCPQRQFLLGTGGTGLGFTVGPDTRITNVNTCRPDRSR